MERSSEDRSRPADGLTFDGELVGPWVAERIGKAWHGQNQYAIGMVKGGEVTMGVIYEDFTGFCCSVHIAVGRPSPTLRTLLYAAFWYPFASLGLEMVMGFVPEHNDAAINLDLRMGFRVCAVIPGVYGGTGLVVMTMRREDCRWIDQPERGNGRQGKGSEGT